MMCDKHQTFFDSDFYEECAVCESEYSDADECEWCGGTGEVMVDAEDGEGHTMRGAGGFKKCTCKLE